MAENKQPLFWNQIAQQQEEMITNPQEVMQEVSGGQSQPEQGVSQAPQEVLQKMQEEAQQSEEAQQPKEESQEQQFFNQLQQQIQQQPTQEQQQQQQIQPIFSGENLGLNPEDFSNNALFGAGTNLSDLTKGLNPYAEYVNKYKTAEEDIDEMYKEEKQRKQEEIQNIVKELKNKFWWDEELAKETAEKAMEYQYLMSQYQNVLDSLNKFSNMDELDRNINPEYQDLLAKKEVLEKKLNEEQASFFSFWIKWETAFQQYLQAQQEQNKDLQKFLDLSSRVDYTFKKVRNTKQFIETLGTFEGLLNVYRDLQDNKISIQEAKERIGYQWDDHSFVVNLTYALNDLKNKINYMYKDNLKDFEKIYDEVRDKYNLPYASDPIEKAKIVLQYSSLDGYDENSRKQILKYMRDVSKYKLVQANLKKHEVEIENRVNKGVDGIINEFMTEDRVHQLLDSKGYTKFEKWTTTKLQQEREYYTQIEEAKEKIEKMYKDRKIGYDEYNDFMKTYKDAEETLKKLIKAKTAYIYYKALWQEGEDFAEVWKHYWSIANWEEAPNDISDAVKKSWTWWNIFDEVQDKANKILYDHTDDKLAKIYWKVFGALDFVWAGFNLIQSAIERGFGTVSDDLAFHYAGVDTDDESLWNTATKLLHYGVGIWTTVFSTEWLWLAAKAGKITSLGKFLSWLSKWGKQSKIGRWAFTNFSRILENAKSTKLGSVATWVIWKWDWAVKTVWDWIIMDAAVANYMSSHWVELDPELDPIVSIAASWLLHWLWGIWRKLWGTRTPSLSPSELLDDPKTFEYLREAGVELDKYPAMLAVLKKYNKEYGDKAFVDLMKYTAYKSLLTKEIAANRIMNVVDAVIKNIDEGGVIAQKLGERAEQVKNELVAYKQKIEKEKAVIGSKMQKLNKVNNLAEIMDVVEGTAVSKWVWKYEGKVAGSVIKDGSGKGKQIVFTDWTRIRWDFERLPEFGELENRVRQVIKNFEAEKWKKLKDMWKLDRINLTNVIADEIRDYLSQVDSPFKIAYARALTKADRYAIAKRVLNAFEEDGEKYIKKALVEGFGKKLKRKDIEGLARKIHAEDELIPDLKLEELEKAHKRVLELQKKYKKLVKKSADKLAEVSPKLGKVWEQLAEEIVPLKEEGGKLIVKSNIWLEAVWLDFISRLLLYKFNSEPLEVFRKYLTDVLGLDEELADTFISNILNLDVAKKYGTEYMITWEDAAEKFKRKLMYTLRKWTNNALTFILRRYVKLLTRWWKIKGQPFEKVLAEFLPLLQRKWFFGEVIRAQTTAQIDKVIASRLWVIRPKEVGLFNIDVIKNKLQTLVEVGAPDYVRNSLVSFVNKVEDFNSLIKEVAYKKFIPSMLTFIQDTWLYNYFRSLLVEWDKEVIEFVSKIMEVFEKELKPKLVKKINDKYLLSLDSYWKLKFTYVRNTVSAFLWNKLLAEKLEARIGKELWEEISNFLNEYTKLILSLSKEDIEVIRKIFGTLGDFEEKMLNGFVSEVQLKLLLWTKKAEKLIKGFENLKQYFDKVDVNKLKEILFDEYVEAMLRAHWAEEYVPELKAIAKEQYVKYFDMLVDSIAGEWRYARTLALAHLYGWVKRFTDEILSLQWEKLLEKIMELDWWVAFTNAYYSTPYLIDLVEKDPLFVLAHEIAHLFQRLFGIERAKTGQHILYDMLEKWGKITEEIEKAHQYSYLPGLGNPSMDFLEKLNNLIDEHKDFERVLTAYYSDVRVYEEIQADYLSMSINFGRDVADKYLAANFFTTALYVAAKLWKRKLDINWLEKVVKAVFGEKMANTIIEKYLNTVLDKFKGFDKLVRSYLSSSVKKLKDEPVTNELYWVGRKINNIFVRFLEWGLSKWEVEYLLDKAITTAKTETKEVKNLNENFVSGEIKTLKDDIAYAFLSIVDKQFDEETSWLYKTMMEEAKKEWIVFVYGDWAAITKLDIEGLSVWWDNILQHFRAYQQILKWDTRAVRIKALPEEVVLKEKNKYKNKRVVYIGSRADFVNFKNKFKGLVEFLGNTENPNFSFFVIKDGDINWVYVMPFSKIWEDMFNKLEGLSEAVLNIDLSGLRVFKRGGWEEKEFDYYQYLLDIIENTLKRGFEIESFSGLNKLLASDVEKYLKIIKWNWQPQKVLQKWLATFKVGEFADQIFKNVVEKYIKESRVPDEVIEDARKIMNEWILETIKWLQNRIANNLIDDLLKTSWLVKLKVDKEKLNYVLSKILLNMFDSGKFHWLMKDVIQSWMEDFVEDFLRRRNLTPELFAAWIRRFGFDSDMMAENLYNLLLENVKAYITPSTIEKYVKIYEEAVKKLGEWIMPKADNVSKLLYMWSKTLNSDDISQILTTAFMASKELGLGGYKLLPAGIKALDYRAQIKEDIANYFRVASKYSSRKEIIRDILVGWFEFTKWLWEAQINKIVEYLNQMDDEKLYDTLADLIFDTEWGLAFIKFFKKAGVKTLNKLAPSIVKYQLMLNAIKRRGFKLSYSLLNYLPDIIERIWNIPGEVFDNLIEKLSGFAHKIMWETEESYSEAARELRELLGEDWWSMFVYFVNSNKDVLEKLYAREKFVSLPGVSKLPKPWQAEDIDDVVLAFEEQVSVVRENFNFYNYLAWWLKELRDLDIMHPIKDFVVLNRRALNFVNFMAWYDSQLLSIWRHLERNKYVFKFLGKEYKVEGTKVIKLNKWEKILDWLRNDAIAERNNRIMSVIMKIESMTASGYDVFSWLKWVRDVYVDYVNEVNRLSKLLWLGKEVPTEVVYNAYNKAINEMMERSKFIDFYSAVERLFGVKIKNGKIESAEGFYKGEVGKAIQKEMKKIFWEELNTRNVSIDIEFGRSARKNFAAVVEKLLKKDGYYVVKEWDEIKLLNRKAMAIEFVRRLNDSIKNDIESLIKVGGEYFDDNFIADLVDELDQYLKWLVKYMDTADRKASEIVEDAKWIVYTIFNRIYDRANNKAAVNIGREEEILYKDIGDAALAYLNWYKDVFEQLSTVWLLRVDEDMKKLLQKIKELKGDIDFAELEKKARIVWKEINFPPVAREKLIDMFKRVYSKIEHEEREVFEYSEKWTGYEDVFLGVNNLDEEYNILRDVLKNHFWWLEYNVGKYWRNFIKNLKEELKQWGDWIKTFAKLLNDIREDFDNLQAMLWYTCIL